jgi:alpha-tubulin suppressor-like RCC1 family protein
MKRSHLFTTILVMALVFLPIQSTLAENQSTIKTATVFTQLDLGYEHSCSLTIEGLLYCWGDNYYDQVGVPGEYDYAYPMLVPGLAQLIWISAGLEHTCVVQSGGVAKCWGADGYGALGDGLGEDSPTPVEVVNFPNAASISAGSHHTCGLTSSGAAFCWGFNGGGACGNGTFDQYILSPVPVTGLSSGVLTISAGDNFSCAVTGAGAAQCWGANYWGQLGNGLSGDNQYQNVPNQVIGLTNGVTSVTTGSMFACALTSTGGVKCWGYGGDGELGNGSFGNSNVPVNVSGLSSGVVAISAGSYHACALLNTGGVRCWGENSTGQLGNNSTTNSNIPVNVTNLSSGVAAISCGGYFTGALMTTAKTLPGNMKAWGDNSSGQLGDGTYDESHVPVDVIVLNYWLFLPSVVK